MDKRKISLDSAHQIGLDAILYGILTVFGSGSTGQDVNWHISRFWAEYFDFD